MGLVYTMPHEVSYYECDMSGQMTPSMLVAVAIKASEQQSEQLGRGTAYIHELGLNWIITEYEIQVKCLPSVGEKLTIKTEAISYNRFFCYRNFWILNEQGEELVSIQAIFALMNQETRKISRVQDVIIEPYESEAIKSIRRTANFLPVESFETTSLNILYYDIDENHHVNNAVYFTWMFAPLGLEFLSTHELLDSHIRFEKEVVYGDQPIVSFEKMNEGETVITKHEILVAGNVCSRGQMLWRKKEIK
ncbi:acyl-[acyl-carrier-protein] thioesterase [Enterococcus alcedinis]|uniref:Acyl-ACP thioesterase n=1 Tax=Enterococcus alcedinis TaxID=1274384 RepID=A0A917JGD8_9ENTE|nr:acyl-ACP thioesterase domain-containing protein [Enterococcus alcedinis]MBP2103196.1 medium-chain acyl-[acyl-carrier-protein] hydrolase [Enterococcus alcedinis]GGI66760.1 acyl-ACP thioesterase [Enterococcus alcedinis]